MSFFFGNSISSFKKDLLDGFDSKVIEALSRTTSGLESSILPLRSSIERARSEIEGWKEKSREWEKVSASFEKYKNIAGDKDKLHAEDFEGALAEASLIEREAVLNDTVSPERRAECLNHLRTIRVGATEKLVTADVAYNASAIGGRLKLGKITEQLAEAAVQLSGNSPVYAARLYRHKVEARSGEDSDAAFNEMMKLVRQRPQATCELIYSEGWNVAEHLRRYRPLIDALEQGADVEAPFEDSTTPRLNHGQPFENAFNELTSYGHAIAAQCYAREGVFGWEIGYKKHHQLAVEKLKTESPMSTWYAHTKRDLNKLSQRLEAGIAEEEDAGLDIISALARDFVQKQKIQERQDRPKKSRGDKAE